MQLIVLSIIEFCYSLEVSNVTLLVRGSRLIQTNYLHLAVNELKSHSERCSCLEAGVSNPHDQSDMCISDCPIKQCEITQKPVSQGH